MRQDSDDAPSAPDTALPRFVLQAVAGFPVVLRLCIHQTPSHDLYLKNLALSQYCSLKELSHAMLRATLGGFAPGGSAWRERRQVWAKRRGSPTTSVLA